MPLRGKLRRPLREKIRKRTNGRATLYKEVLTLTGLFFNELHKNYQHTPRCMLVILLFIKVATSKLQRTEKR